MLPSLKATDSRVRNPRESLQWHGKYNQSKGAGMSRLLLFILLVVPATALWDSTVGTSPSHAAPSTPPFLSVMLPGMGVPRATNQQTFAGYYDSHTVTYLSTDTSSKAQAAAMHINYSAALAADQASPVMYLVGTRAAPNQLAVFASESGESDYSPLWRVTTVTWRTKVKRRVLTSESQILAAARHSQLTVTPSDIVLNCPIVSIGGK